MTREEAIEYIKTNCYGEYCEDDWRNAMDMAIRSLESWDTVIKKLNEWQEPQYPTLVVTMRIDHLINLINECLKEVEDEQIRGEG